MAFSLKNLRSLPERFTGLTNEQKRFFVLLCTGAVVFILVLSVIISAIRSGSRKEIEREDFFPQEIERRIAIPPEDIFFPDEPDFVPGVIPGRERRTAWSEEDALEFWHDPLRQGEEIWRIRIEDAIDGFLERIP